MNQKFERISQDRICPICTGKRDDLRERDRETERQRQRETERDKERQRDREKVQCKCFGLYL